MSRIPIAAAKRISKDYGIDQVVILGRVPESEPGIGDGMEYVTTYGRTLLHCKIAALMGNKLKRILGWPADRCMDKPPRQRRREAAEIERVAIAIAKGCDGRDWHEPLAEGGLSDDQRDEYRAVARNVIDVLENG